MLCVDAPSHDDMVVAVRTGLIHASIMVTRMAHLLIRAGSACRDGLRAPEDDIIPIQTNLLIGYLSPHRARGAEVTC